MLVVFTNKSGGTVDMFEKAALDFIKMMGRRPAVPSAISKEDLPGALDHLQAEIARLEQLAIGDDSDDNDDETEEDDDKPKPIGISTRAFPLIELIKQTIKEDSFLMWDYR
jgi:hypothetical protein